MRSLLDRQFFLGEERGGIQWILPIERYRSVSVTFRDCGGPGGVEQLFSKDMFDHYEEVRRMAGLLQGKRKGGSPIIRNRNLYTEYSIFSTFCWSRDADRGMRSPGRDYYGTYLVGHEVYFTVPVPSSRT